MKIRIKGNTLRIRLSKSEVADFDKNGYIQEHTRFATSIFTYALKSYNGTEMNATFEQGVITMLLPDSMKSEWVNTGRVGFEGTVPVAEGETLQLLLEKDFKCLDENIEDQSDNYDNPLFNKR